MTLPEDDHDPDDNFAAGDRADIEVDEEAATEALLWQLLLAINPGDEEAALQQFSAWQEAMAAADDADAEPVWVLKDVIDWRAGFHVAADDAGGFVESIDELAARWGLRIDWGSDDREDHDDDGPPGSGVTGLIGIAFAQLREHGYTLWTWDSGSTTHSGWITLRQDDEAMLDLAAALGIAVRMGAGWHERQR
jgi:hypothetical protein